MKESGRGPYGALGYNIIVGDECWPKAGWWTSGVLGIACSVKIYAIVEIMTIVMSM